MKKKYKNYILKTEKEFLNKTFKPGDFVAATVDLGKNRFTDILVFQGDNYHIKDSPCLVIPDFIKSFNRTHYTEEYNDLLPLYKNYFEYSSSLNVKYLDESISTFLNDYTGNINDYSKKLILQMKKKDIVPKVKAVIRYFMKDDKKFAIDVYKKNWIFNNELFYNIYSENLDPIKFTLEEIKEIIEAKPFNSKSYIMGSSQRQCQNAINHLLKTQDLTLELIQLILDKYKEDAEVSFSTIRFLISSKEVVIPEGTEKLLSNAINKIAEMIVMNQDLHYLVKSFKKKINTEELTDDTVKLLLECIE